ncbi:MAG: methyltransferase domain-containing protein [Acidimicrobiia bacterium]
MPVHRVADAGFDREAAAYERARPGYPPECIEWFAEHLGIGPGRDVFDLAAGTGKFTRLLEPLGARIVASEPVDGMRAVLSHTSPNVPLVASTAEWLPFRAASFDAITVAQAFHWFDAAAALAEAGRVLRPGGRLGLVWNARDRSAPHVDMLWSIMDRVEKHAPWRQHEQWHESAFTETPFFGPLQEATFHHVQLLTVEQVVERFQSVSHVAVLEPDAKRAVLDEVRALLATHPETVGRDHISIPYRVDAYWCERA